MRIKAVIAYDGSAFYGFQRQTSTPLTITHAIEDVLRSLHIDSPVIGSGRTDRGVHATGQVIHFDIPDFWHDIQRLRYILNQKLDGIYIKHITPVDMHFHARFSAQKRLYRYLFTTTTPSVFERRYLASYPAHFEIDKLHEALSLFEGEHDFKYFHKTGSQPHTTVRTIYHSRYYRYKNRHIITFEADGFLRSQVRMMVEGVMQYAFGKWDRHSLLSQLAGERQYLHTLAPAQGLYLAKIFY